MHALKVRTPDELRDLALALESHLQARYADLAKRMERHDRRSVAAQISRLHDHQQDRVRTLLARGARPRSASSAFANRVLEEESSIARHSELARDPNRSTPYLVLADAVASQRQLFETYSHVAAGAPDPELQRQAELLALEKLYRASRLRVARRAAYHDERARTGNAHAGASSPDFESIDEFFARAWDLEGALYIDLSRATVRHAGVRQALKTTREIIQRTGYDATALDNNSRKPTDQDASLRDLIGASETVFSFYDHVVDEVLDEALLMESQALSALALRRLRELREASA